MSKTMGESGIRRNEKYICIINLERYNEKRDSHQQHWSYPVWKHNLPNQPHRSSSFWQCKPED